MDPGEGVRLHFVRVEDLGHAVELNQRLACRAHGIRLLLFSDLSCHRTGPGVLGRQLEPTHRMRSYESVLGHIRQHHRVAFSQAFDDLHEQHGPSAELEWRARRFSRVGRHPEERDRRVLLSKRRALDKQHIGEPFEFDHAVHAEIGARARRQGAFERHVHAHGPAGRGRVDARHDALHVTITCVDVRRLTDGQILRLCLRDPDDRLQARGVRDARQVRARAHLLSLFDVDQLQLAGHVRLDLQVAELPLRLFERGPALVDRRFVRGELRGLILDRAGQLPPRQLQRVGRPVHGRLFLADHEVRHDAL